MAALDRYLDGDFKHVQGWCIPHLFQTISACHDMQQKLELSGPIAEIGVYHGKFFVGLVLLAGVAHGNYAIDVFDMQQFNLDGAGKGDLAAFENNLQRNGVHDACTIMRADSMTIGRAEIERIKANIGHFSFFSVDGCHMVEHTINDARIAMELTDPRGIIFIDDYYNASWPGVQEGIAKLYLMDTPRWVPLLFTCNKLFLCHISHHAKYLSHINGLLAKRYRNSRLKMVKRFGYDTLTVSPDMTKSYEVVW